MGRQLSKVLTSFRRGAGESHTFVTRNYHRRNEFVWGPYWLPQNDFAVQTRRRRSAVERGVLLVAKSSFAERGKEWAGVWRRAALASNSPIP